MPRGKKQWTDEFFAGCECDLCKRPELTSLTNEPESGRRDQLTQVELEQLFEDAERCCAMMCNARILAQMPQKDKMVNVVAALALLCGRGPRLPIFIELGVLKAEYRDKTEYWDKKQKHEQVELRMDQLEALEKMLQNLPAAEVAQRREQGEAAAARKAARWSRKAQAAQAQKGRRDDETDHETDDNEIVYNDEEYDRTRLPPGTDHAKLVAQIMAFVRYHHKLGRPHVPPPNPPPKRPRLQGASDDHVA